MNRRGFLKALLAVPVAAMAVPLARFMPGVHGPAVEPADSIMTLTEPLAAKRKLMDLDGGLQEEMLTEFEKRLFLTFREHIELIEMEMPPADWRTGAWLLEGAN